MMAGSQTECDGQDPLPGTDSAWLRWIDPTSVDVACHPTCV